MSGAAHFDGRATDYAAWRPPYPRALWDRIRRTGLLQPDRRALDLGAGTGQATGPLLAAGLDVVAVEPGPRLAALLRSAHPTARVVGTTAEEARLPSDTFDLVVAATSLHWMDLDVVLPKVSDALRVGGRFLVFRNVFGDPEAPATAFRARVQEVVADRVDQDRSGRGEEVEPVAAQLTDSGHFVIKDREVFRWSVRLDERQVRGLFGTFSDWSEDEVDRVGDAVCELGGSVVEHYSSWLLVAAPRRTRA